VFNIRWGIITAISALIISVALGIFSGVGTFHIFIRAVIFTVIFFGFGIGLRFVIDNFFPDLIISVKESEKQDEQSGSRINITVDSTGEYAVPELYKAPEDNEELGNIESLLSGASRPRNTEGRGYINENQSKAGLFEIPSLEESIDLEKEAGYNDSVAVEKPAVEKPTEEKPQFTASFGEDFGLGGLPDLDMMAMAFSTGEAQSADIADFGSPVGSFGANVLPDDSESSFFSSPVSSVEESEPDRGQYKGNKPQPLQGDFDPRDLAKGISTILKKS